jgi:hypothetical protein
MMPCTEEDPDISRRGRGLFFCFLLLLKKIGFQNNALAKIKRY